MIKHDTLHILGPDAQPGLLNWVQSKHLQVPEFQRDFLWATKPDRTTSLLASVAQQWPAGSLLLMEGQRGFQTNPVAGWGKDPDIEIAKKPGLSLLDGQQRITGLYQAYTGRSHDKDYTKGYVFYVAVADLLAHGAIDPEEEGGTFRWMSSREWKAKNLVSIDAQRDGGIITLKAVIGLLGDPEWQYWMEGFDADMRAAYQDLRDKGPLAGLRSYEFPVSTVLENAPDEVLARIFVTINEQGIKLSTFDLAVARTVRKKTSADPGFNLRDRWEAAYGVTETEDEGARDPVYPWFRAFGIRPEVPLKLILLLTKPTTRISDGEVLGIEPSDVQGTLDKAFKLLHGSIDFLVNRIGLIPQTLPDANYILPIAFLGDRKGTFPPSEELGNRIEQWYWAAVFSSLFGRGRTGDIVPEEANNLAAWASDPENRPDVIESFWRIWDQDIKFRLFRGLATNQHLMRAIFALEVAEGATDWRGQKHGKTLERFPLRDAAAWPRVPLDVHHMYPRGVKSPTGTSKYKGIDIPSGTDAYESVVNRCLLLRSTNAAIGAVPFNAVKKREGVNEDWIATYLVDPNAKNWVAFVKQRFNRIETALGDRIPS
jgi:hypothetical protein